MAKSVLYRLFGLGKTPKRELPALEAEGIVLVDEGISGSIECRFSTDQARLFLLEITERTGAQ